MKDGAIPTLSDYNRDKQPSKRKKSCARLEIVNKKQLCEEAFEHYDRWENLEVEKYGKGVHTNQKITSIGPQTDISHSVFSLRTKDQSTQINGIGESIFETEEEKETESECSDQYSSCNKSDTDFLQSNSSDSMEEGKEQNEMNSSAFMLFWSSLVVLLSRCFTCFAKFKLIKKIRGSLLIVTISSSNGHKNIWRSQPLVNRQSHGNIKLSAAVLLSANTYMRMAQYFRLAGVQLLSKTKYCAFSINI